jgi:hypothetical protein
MLRRADSQHREINERLGSSGVGREARRTQTATETRGARSSSATTMVVVAAQCTHARRGRGEAFITGRE